MSKATKNIEQTVTIGAEPSRVYAALMDSGQHSAFTGEPAQIDPQKGGAFTCYDNYILGLTLELEPGKRIVQAWRSRNWPAGTYSIVTFKLAKKTGGKTLLRFSQVGVPAKDFAEKSKGWRSHYWDRLNRFFRAT